MATTTEAAWTAFADKMRAEDAIPPLASWNELLTTAANSGELDKALWILGTMKATGTRPTAVTYEILLAGCAAAGNRTVAFSLIEQMWDDKVLLGDVCMSWTFWGADGRRCTPCPSIRLVFFFVSARISLA